MYQKWFQFHLQYYSDPFGGDLFMEAATLPYYLLENVLNNIFGDTHLNYQHCLLTIDCSTVAIFKSAEGNFKIFDSHSRDLYGIPHPFGKGILISVKDITNLVTYLQNIAPQGNVTLFEIRGVTATESEAEKQNRLENARKYRRKKRAHETSTEKQTRLATANQYKRKKRLDNSGNNCSGPPVQTIVAQKLQINRII
jgi:hypothetical protein